MRRPTLIEVLLSLLVIACFLIAAGVWRAVPARDAASAARAPGGSPPPPWLGTQRSAPRDEPGGAKPAPIPPPYGVTVPPAGGTGTAPLR